ncbi:MAG: hypothetical protein ACR5LD_12100 [Symbiopectobacterium sp.]
MRQQVKRPRFIDALSRTLPHLVVGAEVIWRYEFARGAAMHVLTVIDADPRLGRLTLLSQELCDNRDVTTNRCWSTCLSLSAPVLRAFP